MAHTKRLGTFCELFYDTDAEVRDGDVVRTTAREPSHYRVVCARRVSERTKHYPYRWNLECVRIGPEDVLEEDRVHPLCWYQRKKRKEQACPGR